ncbi:partial Lactate utilization protein B, partial [Methylacidimicrobium cyclopophantes]
MEPHPLPLLEALADRAMRRAVAQTVDRLQSASDRRRANLPDWERWREEARRVREETLAHLDLFLGRFVEKLREAGGRIHFAEEGEEACRMVVEILHRQGARRVVKSKSMVSEEIGLNRRLVEAGIAVVETDLGERIVQQAQGEPAHLVVPAIGRSREEIRKLFVEMGAEGIGSGTRELVDFARSRLREEFRSADAGITGVNFAIAQTGSLALFTNEGNADLVANLPPLHIALLGIERLLPTLEDLALFSRLLP